LDELIIVLNSWLSVQQQGFFYVYPDDDSWNLVNDKDYRHSLRIELMEAMLGVVDNEKNNEENPKPARGASEKVITSRVPTQGKFIPSSLISLAELVNFKLKNTDKFQVETTQHRTQQTLSQRTLQHRLCRHYRYGPSTIG
jgi:hypothetical protein